MTKLKKAKWLSEEDLQIAEERREVKSKGEREIYTQLIQNCKEQQEEKRPSLMNNVKKQRKTIEWERLEIFSRKLQTSKEHFRQ